MKAFAFRTTFVYLALVALMVGCAELGIVTPQTFEEQLAYGYSQNAAIRTSAAQSLKSGVITKSDAQQVLSTTDTARSALDEARKFQAAGDTSTAVGKLQMATSLLTTVQTFLQSRGVK